MQLSKFKLFIYIEFHRTKNILIVQLICKYSVHIFSDVSKLDIESNGNKKSLSIEFI